MKPLKERLAEREKRVEVQQKETAATEALIRDETARRIAEHAETGAEEAQTVQRVRKAATQAARHDPFKTNTKK